MDPKGLKARVYGDFAEYSGWQSFQCPQHVTVDFENNHINLPKIKGIKSKLHRPFTGKVKTVTVKRCPSGKYYAIVLVDDGAIDPVEIPVSAGSTAKGAEVFLYESQEAPTITA